MKISAQNGDRVEIHYTGKLQDKTVFDTTGDDDPIEFVVGSSDVITGISVAVVGMMVGDKKTVELSPESAYGHYNENLIVNIPTDKIPGGVKEGAVLSDSRSGQTFVVREINGESTVLDGNHPLAGQTLIFDIEMVSIA